MPSRLSLPKRSEKTELVRGRCHQSTLPRLFFIPTTAGGYPYRQDLILVPSNCECLVTLGQETENGTEGADSQNLNTITSTISTLWVYFCPPVPLFLFLASAPQLFSIYFFFALFRLVRRLTPGEGSGVGGVSSQESTIQDEGFILHQQDFWSYRSFCFSFQVVYPFVSLLQTNPIATQKFQRLLSLFICCSVYSRNIFRCQYSNLILKSQYIVTLHPATITFAEVCKDYLFWSVLCPPPNKVIKCLKRISVS
jgi:hypothetical protein